MSHLVYCWEMGGGLGHVVALARLAQAMTAQGHRVSCVLGELEQAPRMLDAYGIAWLQAPRIRNSLGLPSPINHADMLRGSGYRNADNLHALLGAWRTLFSVLRPDRVICEYAPTARLAAWSMGIDVVCVDTGFSMPPLSDPLPAVSEISVEPSMLMRAETRTLEVINQALPKVGARPLERFSDLFRAPVWYRNWCEFNHFGPHSPERHLGQVFGDSGGATPVFPKGDGPKLFAYLKPEHAGSMSARRGAVKEGDRVVAYLPEFPAAAVEQLERTGKVTVSDRPFRLGELDDDVEIGIWHSPTGGVARCLDKGMRMVFMPMHFEQVLACKAVERAGLPARIVLRPEDWTMIFEQLRALPSAKLDERWQPADVPLFAARLAGG